METGNPQLPARGKNIADSLHLAVWWNVGSVALTFQGDDGTVRQNTKRQYGNALQVPKRENDFVQIARVFQNR